MRGILQHLAESDLQGFGVVFARFRKNVHAMLQCTLEITRTIRAPNAITSIIRAGGGAGHITDSETDFGRAIRVDGVFIDVFAGITKPECRLGHGPLAFARETSIETVIEGDGVLEERVEIESDGGLSEGVDAAGIPEGAVLSRDELKEDDEQTE